MGCQDADLIERTKNLQKGHHRRVCLGSCKIDTPCRLTKHTCSSKSNFMNMMCHWQLETEEGRTYFSSNPEHRGQLRCLTPQIACWHVLACVIAFSYRTFLQLVIYVNFSIVPLQEQKIENCNSFHGMRKWTQMDDAWRATDVD